MILKIDIERYKLMNIVAESYLYCEEIKKRLTSNIYLTSLKFKDYKVKTVFNHLNEGLDEILKEVLSGNIKVEKDVKYLGGRDEEVCILEVQL
ncbi:hypothetical protein [Anaerosphaera multitolerans]|uniref:Uncharacterized protein n=1 Tax=Anaerosphaera multitolerans TaxID=2487351 RepID=A0A437SA87_9FIRM|nr:hypothetical protein [Anaerosphaera multitolerans]RVU55718.1 hypothetical protein EF514_00445 [Anaerosphaera multitolerans]